MGVFIPLFYRISAKFPNLGSAIAHTNISPGMAIAKEKSQDPGRDLDFISENKITAHDVLFMSLIITISHFLHKKIPGNLGIPWQYLKHNEATSTISHPQPISHSAGLAGVGAIAFLGLMRSYCYCWATYNSHWISAQCH